MSHVFDFPPSRRLSVAEAAAGAHALTAVEAADRARRTYPASEAQRRIDKKAAMYARMSQPSDHAHGALRNLQTGRDADKTATDWNALEDEEERHDLLAPTPGYVKWIVRGVVGLIGVVAACGWLVSRFGGGL